MKTSKIIPYLIIIITFPSITQWLYINTDNLTALWWILFSAIIFIFIYARNNFRGQPLPVVIKFFTYLVFFESIYGIFLSDGYWDYKSLINNLFTYLLPLSFFVFSIPQILSTTIKKWIKFALPAFFVFLPIMQPEAPGKYLIPIMFVVLFLKPIPIRYKWVIILFFSFIFIYGSLGARSSVIKYSVSLLMGLCFYSNIYKKNLLLKIAHISLMILPFILIIVGVLGIFNIFKIDEYLPKISGIEVENSYDKNEKEDISSDTRTFIYEEGISSALKNNYVLQGHSLARGYTSMSFAETDFYKRGERYDSEVSIINIFTHMGLVGVIIYFSIFWTASYKAIYKSRNMYIKMLGIYICFRWVFAWIEDFNRFDLNYLFVWIMISMCFSNQFRQMNDRKFERWVKSIFIDLKFYKYDC